MSKRVGEPAAMGRRIYRFTIAGCVVELEQQWAVRIKFGGDTPGLNGATQERALHYSKDEAVRSICERMGEIVDKERGLGKGTGALLVTGAIRDAFDGEVKVEDSE